jgi:hypothetical protein
MAAPAFAEVIDVLHEIAPLELAADWDNVGVVLEARARRGAVARALLTIDLTEPVVAEAAQGRADLVVAYHPPIFQGIKRLSAADPRQRAVLTRRSTRRRAASPTGWPRAWPGAGHRRACAPAARATSAASSNWRHPRRWRRWCRACAGGSVCAA